ncbi:hypothetical protein [Draconibacterium sediminis]|uniref:Uncharacterized protein n=1 Tax=Draconibacterium sediminis TaxID=1544798 RepID=A0A0D8JBK7_9BACT|nr:hypothetical protein [Draconibacterium sediminis]KJF44277.1 hypothetical protein LH29_01810 [Draconibacterium sediminis]
MVKYIIYISCFVTLIFGCTNKNKSVSNIEDNVNFIELYNNHQWINLVEKENILLKQAESNFVYYLILSESFAAIGDINKSIQYAKQWIVQDSSDYNAYLTLGNSYLIADSLWKAEQCYLKVLEMGPYHARAMLHLAEVYKQLNQPNLAIIQYLNAIELFSENGFQEEVIQYSSEVLKLDSANFKAKNYLEQMSKSP